MSEEKKELTFIDHIDVLRKYLIRAAIGVAACSVIGFVFFDYIFTHIILAPTTSDFYTFRWLCELNPVLCVTPFKVTFQDRTMLGSFTTYMNISIMIGIVLSMPLTLFQLWKFIEPALYAREKKNALLAIFTVTFFFVLGLLYSYFIICPITVNFLYNFTLGLPGGNIIEKSYDIGPFIGDFLFLILVSALIFELPVIVYILSYIGILSAAFMKNNRRYAYLILVIVAAIITPTSDVFTLSLVSVPAILLYEIGILFSGSIERKRHKAMMSSTESL